MGLSVSVTSVRDCGLPHDGFRALGDVEARASSAAYGAQAGLILVGDGCCRDAAFGSGFERSCSVRGELLMRWLSLRTHVLRAEVAFCEECVVRAAD